MTKQMRSHPLNKSTPRDPFLESLGERVRLLRARRGLTRKGLSQAAGVSERHLANLEQGVGNASILVLREVALALNCPLPELLGDKTALSPEWLLLRDLLRGLSAAELQRARLVLAPMFGAAPETAAARLRRIALIGLRGAGKSTLGRLLSAELQVPFVEVSQEIERVAGGSVAEIHLLYGSSAYHRYEHRVLDETIGRYRDVVISTPGSIVSEPTTFGLLLSHCYTVWVQASPEEHMQRVVDQGDLRPMGGNGDHREAMADLKRILAGRAAFYSKADVALDTSGHTVDESFAKLKTRVGLARRALTASAAAVPAGEHGEDIDANMNMHYSADRI